MVDILVLDGRDERLKFLGLDGILTATCCPSCVGCLLYTSKQELPAHKPAAPKKREPER